jgi:hypothetical protein
MKTGRRFCSALGLLITASIAHADIQIFASLDRTQIAMTDQAILKVTVSGTTQNLPDPQLPGLADFQVSNAGASQNYSWVNGQTTASVTHNFVLSPKQVGHFTIPPIRLQAEGKTLETTPLTIDVVKGDPSALPAEPSQPAATPQGSAEQGSPAVFVTGSVDKASAYVGEPVTYSFRLYNRAAFTRQPQYQPPDTSGFWMEDLPPQRNFRTAVKGIPYQAVEVRSALFPTHAGKATIGSAALNVAIQNVSGDPFNGDIFANFFGGGQEKTLRSEPITVHVKPLPTPAPAGFHGAVGEYDLSAQLDKTSTQVGQPLTLTVSVSGRGNIKSIPDIQIPAMTNFRMFDANASTNIDKKDYRVQGSKTFKTVLIPTASGDQTLPALTFVYFDPAAGTYKTLKSKPLNVHVKPAPAGSTPPAFNSGPGNTTAPGIKVLNQDIRYIKTPASISSQSGMLYRMRAYLGVNALAFLALVGSGLLPLYRRLFLSDPDRVRFRNARSQAGAHLKEAEAALARAEGGPAGRALSQSLQVYLAGKLGLPEGGLSLRSVAEELTARGIAAPRIEKVRELWDSFDRFQFAPARVRPEDVRVSLDALRELIAGLEREIPWKD